MEFITNIKSGTNNLFIYTKWDELSISFKIVDQNDKYWTGSIELAEISAISSELELNFEIFLNEIKSALSMPDNKFLYEMQNEQFILKKNEDIKIIYFEVNLIPLNENLHNDFLLKSIEIINIKSNKLNEITKKFENNSEELKKLKLNIAAITEEQKQTEQTLMNKFCLLLNSKKDKISKLQELLYEKDKKLDDTGTDTDDDELHLPTQQKCINLPRRQK